MSVAVSLYLIIYISGAAIGCRLVAVALQVSGVGCADHVGRLVAFLVALRCVGWLSSGRGAAFLMLGGSRSSCRDWSGCRLVLMVSDVAPYRQPCRLLMLSRCRAGVAVILSGSAAGRRSFAPYQHGDRRPRARIIPATGTPWAYIYPRSVAAVPRRFQQRSVLIQKWEKVIFSKLAISVGATKSANLPTIVKNKQLFFSFCGGRSSVLTFQVLMV